MLPAHLKDLKGVFISQVSLYYKTDKEWQAHWKACLKHINVVVSKPRISIFDEMTNCPAASNNFICKQTPLTI
jgi:hypothetical protein